MWNKGDLLSVEPVRSAETGEIVYFTISHRTREGCSNHVSMPLETLESMVEWARKKVNEQLIQF